MTTDFRRLPPDLENDRRRRRLRLLTEFAEAKALRARVSPRRARAQRLRELVDLRRRLA